MVDHILEILRQVLMFNVLTMMLQIYVYEIIPLGTKTMKSCHLIPMFIGTPCML